MTRAETEGHQHLLRQTLVLNGMCGISLDVYNKSGLGIRTSLGVWDDESVPRDVHGFPKMSPRNTEGGKIESYPFHQQCLYLNAVGIKWTKTAHDRRKTSQKINSGHELACLCACVSSYILTWWQAAPALYFMVSILCKVVVGTVGAMAIDENLCVIRVLGILSTFRPPEVSLALWKTLW